MFKNKPKTVLLKMPEGYSFEFSFETNLQSENWDPVTNRRWAKMTWNLFYNNNHISDGEKWYTMDQKNLEAQVFIFGRRQALNHIKVEQDKNEFLYTPDVVYTYGSGAHLSVDEKLVRAYDY